MLVIILDSVLVVLSLAYLLLWRHRDNHPLLMLVLSLVLTVGFGLATKFSAYQLLGLASFVIAVYFAFVTVAFAYSLSEQKRVR